MQKTFLCSFLFLTACISIPLGDLYAQHDTTYYTSYANLITSRFYFSQKYTALRLRNKKEDYTLNYSPNTTLNMGVGATYKWATLNLAYGFGFLNPNKQKGKTKYLDLQFHGYGKKINIDVLGQFYRGFYLYPKGRGSVADRYYVRPDVRVNLVGASVQYIFNYKRFSFRSSLLQNEWQKKSAGTILLGLETYAGSIKGDSTLTPFVINSDAAITNERETSFFQTGINIGYAYTLVIQRNFFVTGSASASYDYGISSLLNDDGKKWNSGITRNTLFRLGTGYNSSRWGVSIIFINTDVRLAAAHNRAFTLHTGNVRTNLIYRFEPGKRQKRILKILD
jgi:hypothetical protein